VKAANQLQAIAHGADAAQSKLARKALYKLGQQNIHPDEAPPKPADIDQPYVEQITFYATNVAGNGNQMFIYIAEDRFGGSPHFFSALVHHGKGIQAFGSNKVARKDIAPSLESLKQNRGGMVAEAPIDYGRFLLAEAVAHTKAAKGIVPKGFSELIGRVGPPEHDYPEAYIYTLLDAKEIATDMSVGRDGAKLFDTDFFTGWLIDLEKVVEWEEKYWDAVKTSLVLEHHQRLKRGDAVIDEAADALLDATELKRLKRRLEEEALVLHLNKETELAKSALYHALQLDSGKLAHDMEFSRLMTLRSVHLVMALKAEQEGEPEEETEPEEPETPSLIIPG
ncbi:MAG: hypothetical protein ABJA67_16495, partial [Chthonomonadales bacterium]